MSEVKIIPIGTPRTVRERLLETLGNVLARKGFEDLTLEDVVAAAGLERAVVLRHFKDLEAMVAAFAQTSSYWPGIAELREGMGEEFAAMPVKAQLTHYVQATIRGLLARPRTLDILAWELMSRNRLSRLLEVPRLHLSMEFFEDAAGELAESLDLPAVLEVLTGTVILLTVRSRQNGVCGGLNLYDAADRTRVDRVLAYLIAGLSREEPAG